jgi:hypothetical protein
MKIDAFARMVSELRELDERISKLTSFLVDVQLTPGFREGKDVTADDEADLQEQRHHMNSYRTVLARRLARKAQEL